MTRADLQALMKGIGPVIRELNSQVKDLTARVKELESQPRAHDAGTWHAGAMYEAGALVTFGGSGWICTTAHIATAEFDHGCFRLFVKRGKDGKDAR